MKKTHFDLHRQDMHSHLLPGLDDGARSVEEAVSLAVQLHEMGYTKLITTPHIMSGVYHNDADTIFPALDTLRNALERNGTPIELDAAAEYLMDDYFESLLSSREPLLTIGGKYVLVEFPFVSMPVNCRTVFFEMKMAGYEPVLAHPERYSYLHDDPEFFQELSEGGVLLQVNILSLHGYYGTRVQKAARRLLEMGLVQFTGTDVHHQRHINALQGKLPDASTLSKLTAGLIKNESL
ncbi:tyrosine-protein phosphatase [Chitinophaga lutea]